MIGLHPVLMGSCAVLRPLLAATAKSAQPLGCPQQLAKPTPFESAVQHRLPDHQSRYQGASGHQSGKAVGFELKEVGPSAGFRQFCRGNIPLTNASRPISAKELKSCANNGIHFIKLPIAFDAITVAVKPGNTWANTHRQ